MAFSNPNDQTLQIFFKQLTRIVVLGLSPKSNRPSFRVAQSLIEYGYEIVPVRPAIDKILAAKAYADLRQVPGEIALVDVFRASEHVGRIVDECIELGVKAIWLQEGVVDEAAAERAQSAGMLVVMDRCIYKELYRLLGPAEARTA